MTSAGTPFLDPAVAAVFDAYPARVRVAMLELRELIFASAANTGGVGELAETLKWGEPAYLTAKSKTGSTIRIGWKPKLPDRYAMYFICQTDLADTFRSLFPEDLTCEGNRAIVFELGKPVPAETLALCVSMALTYHVRKGTA